MFPIAAENAELTETAKAIAECYGFEYVDLKKCKAKYVLVVTDERLECRNLAEPKIKPIYVDFLTGRSGHRRRFGGGRGQLIAKAVSVKEDPLKIIDATAGLGRDGFVLADLGCRVIFLERNPVIMALLRDGLSRTEQAESCSHLNYGTLCLDAISYINGLTIRPHVIYLDPMFPERTKSALVKKEMRMLKDIVGDDDDAGELLRASLPQAKRRVVVKRPRLAPKLPGPKPSMVYTGRSCRFDVYLTGEAKKQYKC